ncbi:MAG: acetolactate synthase small subunit [Clostridia bacterium]|nr:acetolactate synthase small subunit [Clostridia bacterium]
MLKTISILVDNEAGVLARVTNLFSRRGYNIDSLAVGTADVPSASRITVRVDCDARVLEQIIYQVGKLICVHKVKVLDADALVSRELTLIKVRADAAARSEIIDIAQVFRARIIDLTPDALTIELTGDGGKTDALLDMLRPYGVIEMARTGIVALDRGSESISDSPYVFD